MNSRSAASATANATGSEPALKYVQANGVRFAYLEQGSGPLVMFMHGFPDNAKRIVLPDVGHFPHLEREAEVTGLIMDWFKTHAPA